jgi:uncharacterized protein
MVTKRLISLTELLRNTYEPRSFFSFIKSSKVLLIIRAFVISCKNKPVMQEQITSYAFRLKPGEDLKKQIDSVVLLNKMEAGWVATAVGSLTRYVIRFANQANGSSGTGHFEIISLTGTVSTQGNHLHISISDSTGKTIGGHLLEGCTVYTTAEIVIMCSSRYIFLREKDGSTDWPELQVKENPLFNK